MDFIPGTPFWYGVGILVECLNVKALVLMTEQLRFALRQLMQGFVCCGQMDREMNGTQRNTLFHKI